MKIDLHNHLLIGFQPEWLRVQGYSSRNLAWVLVNSAIRKDIGLVAITSENFEIPEGSIHDRFTQICEDAKYFNEETCGCSAEKIGENVLRIDNLGHPINWNSIYVVNSQTVIVEEAGRRYDHLVIGSNQVPNRKDFDYALKYCRDNNLLNFLEHPAVENHLGTGLVKAERLIQKYGDIITGIEGHNAQMIWPESWAKAPLIGPFNKGVNKKAIGLANKVEKPFIATSDAHSPNQIGAANIKTEDNPQFSNELEVFSYIKKKISGREYYSNNSYVSPYSWMKNAAIFQIGRAIFRMRANKSYLK
ncbi:MAG: PHP-associated domain-containing protein [Nanoarchaeota archaeon]